MTDNNGHWSLFVNPYCTWFDYQHITGVRIPYFLIGGYAKMDKEKSNALETARVISKGQITVPKNIREQLGITEGDRIAFVKEPSGKMY
ncbi:AbrB/MazE/SpoVT family DNA-binding domain-containing protein [Shimazuella sp. AN120528]|uniref:AbrB/MazE/SpoVT family DNA-binding domain-containing protein n=1 Tax=Shimazuella soli TaxID=1892854 RepID=UPI001F0FBECC|nr:AbrB/MazE/SpoVT family DNA-binding domain-containing protein [Shimazuella soli]MCH5583693.1 AbrB/MazE/SpoVT family DNA-binding domain-containing protein [Shimazuella soli]